MRSEHAGVEYHVPGHRVLTKGNVGLAVVLQPLEQSAPRSGAGAPDAATLLASVNFSQQLPLVVANTHLLFNQKRGDIKLAQLRCVVWVWGACVGACQLTLEYRVRHTQNVVGRGGEASRLVQRGGFKR